MINYFYLDGHGTNLKVWFVDSKRKARVVAGGSLWQSVSTVRIMGGTMPATLPIVEVN